MILDEHFMYGIADAVKRLRPDADFELTNTKFTQWFDRTAKQPPSWDEIMEQFEKDREEYERLKYARDRSKEYPPVGEQLDMLWHAMNEGVIQGKDTPWFKMISSIKEKYPKP